MFIPTVEPDVFIEEERPGYVRYIRVTTGTRWEVRGICDYRGDCLVGAINPVLGPRETRLDVPVIAGFRGCCPLEVTEL